MSAWYWSGGIGDVFVVESFYSDAERSEVARFFWATRAQRHAAPLFGLLPNYPALKDHVFLHDDFSRIGAFFGAGDFRKRAPRGRELPADVVDRSIEREFPRLADRPDLFMGSSFLRFPIADVARLGLPKQFTFIHPYTNHNLPHHRYNRDMTRADWANALLRLQRLDQVGVVVNTGADFVPNHPRIVNLANRTTLAEAVEVLKRADGYLGIDSCFAALACQRFGPDQLHIRAENTHYHDWPRMYCSPHRAFPFVVRSIQP